MSKAQQLIDNTSLAGVLGPDFLYGAASASYQIEGGYEADGKGPSIWDVYLKGKENGEVACDSYNLWKEDVKLLKSFGCNTYRFSISWPRVRPTGGKGEKVNELGIKYYSDLIDALIAEGITPCVTIFHWDHPQELEDRYKGFASEEIIEDFVSYAELLFDRLGDRVKHWISINEPFVIVILHELLLHKDTWTKSKDNAIFTKNLILCHAKTVDLYRKKYQTEQKGSIGITLNCDFVVPFDESDKAKLAADGSNAYVLGVFADPIFLGKCSEYMQEEWAEYKMEFSDEEWGLIKGSSDFFGLNHYGTSWATGRPKNGSETHALTFGDCERVSEKDGKAIGNRGYNGHPYDVPWGFRKLLQHVHERYLLPNSNLRLWVTENGFAIDGEDKLTREEAINDIQRQEYYAGYIGELAKAVKEDGMRIEGYMAWSLLDNLEWDQGYAPRFGLTIVDMKDGCKRYPKDSSKVLPKIFEHLMGKKLLRE